MRGFEAWMEGGGHETLKNNSRQTLLVFKLFNNFSIFLTIILIYFEICFKKSLHVTSMEKFFTIS